jgi:tRNA pseudouridine13 synthase
MTDDLPYLTETLGGIGGSIRTRLDDFRVEELPLYEPSGEGTHVYFRINKVGIPTPTAVERIARYMGVRRGDIGVAGLKDAQAVTTQMLSLEHCEPQKLTAYCDPQMRVTWTSHHGNKLRTGHLAGNRFRIRIRNIAADADAQARAILDMLIAHGVPNYYGEQRFGQRGDTHLLGRALVTGDLDEFLRLYLGRPRDDDPLDCRAARDAFDAGYYDRALKRWPRYHADQRRALGALKKRRNARSAVAAIDKRKKRLFVSAFQSVIFNDVLAERIGSLDRVMDGDWAQKHDSGGVFLVENAPAEQPRAEAFEISPTGPILGYRSRLAEGEPGQIERNVAAAHGVTSEDFRRIGSLKLKGTRRALRFAMRDPALRTGRDDHGEFLELDFALSSGCYATAVLREIMKRKCDK